MAGAAEIYRRLLAAYPPQSPVLNKLGQIELRMGNAEAGIALLRRSLSIEPGQPAVLSNLAVGLRLTGKHEEALGCIDRALALAPDRVKTWNNAGDILCEINRFDEAVKAYSRVVAVDPGNVRAYCGLAAAYLELLMPQQALAAAESAIAKGCNDAQAFGLRGSALKALKRLQEALTDFDRALVRDPRDVVALNNKGAALLILGRWNEALVCCDRVLAINPNIVQTLYTRGKVLLVLKRFPEALETYNRVLALNADSVEALCNRANALLAVDRCDEALTDCDRALAIDANLAEALCNRANVLLALNRYDEALIDCDRALALAPGMIEAHNNRGVALLGLNRPQEALAACERAVAIDAGYAEAYWNQALSRLTLGDYENGWKLFEWRWQGTPQRQFAREFADPPWLGEEDVAGKTVLLHAEQGFGDTFQFSRYIPMVCALGAKVVVRAPENTLSVLASLKAEMTLVAKGQPLPAFDVHCPLMSLPLAFKTVLDTVPAKVPYLYADEAKRAIWRKALGDKSRPRIGLCWTGKPRMTVDAKRSMTFAQLAPLLRLPFSFHAVNKDLRLEDRAAAAAFPQLAVHTDELHDFSDTAALIAELDLVISVDTSLAHLTGALGKPVWVLLPWASEWRWLMDRRDSPWYPTAELFRQPADGDWQSVIGEVVRRLEMRFSEPLFRGIGTN